METPRKRRKEIKVLIRNRVKSKQVSLASLRPHHFSSDLHELDRSCHFLLEPRTHKRDKSIFSFFYFKQNKHSQHYFMCRFAGHAVHAVQRRKNTF